MRNPFSFRSRNDLTGECNGSSYMKDMVTFIIVNAVVWVYLTYLLAFLGRESIAEKLSITVVNVVIGTVITYAIKATIENVSKYKWNGETLKTFAEPTIEDTEPESEEEIDDEGVVTFDDEDVEETEDQ